MQTLDLFPSQLKKVDPVQEYGSLAELNAATLECRRCEWCSQATQVVLGEGSQTAQVMLVGEQPGDQEDRKGRPFIGPAGQLLDAALSEAGIERSTTYLTNAVKHFKWIPRGKIRLHQKPNQTDITACRPWLEHEARLVRPTWLICLGTTAASAIFGKAVRLKDVRGQILATSACAQTLCTTHPSAVLRTPEAARNAAFADLVADLRLVSSQLQVTPPKFS